MLSRAFDHICIEKARYKFLIIIIIIIIIIIMITSGPQCLFEFGGAFKIFLSHMVCLFK